MNIKVKLTLALRSGLLVKSLWYALRAASSIRWRSVLTCCCCLYSISPFLVSSVSRRATWALCPSPRSWNWTLCTKIHMVLELWCPIAQKIRWLYRFVICDPTFAKVAVLFRQGFPVFRPVKSQNALKYFYNLHQLKMRHRESWHLHFDCWWFRSSPCVLPVEVGLIWDTI